MSLNAQKFNKEITLFPVAARSSSADGSAVDVRSYKGQAKALLFSAAGTGTTPTLDVKLQSSLDGSTGWADISGAAFTGVTDAAAALEGIGVTTEINYLRAVATIGGGTPSFTFGVALITRQQKTP